VSNVLYRNFFLINPSHTVRRIIHGFAWIAWVTLVVGPACSQTLRETAERSGVLVGTAVRPEQLSESPYAATLAREFNMLEPEDAMKWEVLHPAPESFDFSQADRIVAFAISHQMKVRGHTLVWHQQNPPWLTEARHTPEQLARILEQHIKTVVGHYRGKVFAWDVVNEAFDEGAAGRLRSTIWYDKPGITREDKGYAYIEDSFRWAHAADPDALLFYNDAEAEALNPKSDKIYAMVRDLRRRGVPINGVGLQMHISNPHPDIASISENIRRFTALGVQVHITEMDVALPVNADGNPTPADLQLQADVYRKIASACLAHAGCTAIQTWGFTDKYSWIGSHSKHTQGAALLFDREYRPKPAYEALKETLRGRRSGGR
jgi:endo-1,4-beta-xylanase